MKKVVILLPTYNEKQNLAKFIDQVFAQQKETPDWSYEILVVDSHSPDGTFEIAQDLARKDKRIHAIQVGRGLGVALIEGHQYSISHFKPDALAQLDADGQVTPDVLPRLLKTLDEGYTLAIGSRFVKGGKNQLSFMRRVFTYGSCTFCRLVMGPLNIQEFTNSARAFTPELFKKLNLKRMPWREQSYIVQPAFLNEAVIAGAKYKEVPLVFKNREEGYSKNKVFNYTYDVITYAIDARLNKLGLNIPFFKWTRKIKVGLKFGVVGVVGTIVDFTIYNIAITQFGVPPASARLISIPIAILNNFLLNNFWTFSGRKTTTNIWTKLVVFYLVSLGGVAIAVLLTKLLHSVYGDGVANVLGVNIAYYNIYFLVTIFPVMIWNFAMNHFITWKNKKD